MAAIDNLSVQDWRRVDLAQRGNLLRGLNSLSGTAARLVTYGRILLSAQADLKAKSGHGHWLRWLKAHFRWSDRYTRYLMALADYWPLLSPEARQGSLRGALAEIPKQPKQKPQHEKVSSVVFGDNADLIASVARLYIKAGNKVADVTFGGGNFWKKTDLDHFTLLKSDLLGHKDIASTHFRHLPYEDGSLNVVVLDPPYAQRGNHLTAKDYNSRMTGYRSHRQVIRLYSEGMREAKRVLSRGGLLWIKCQDEVESGKQRWTHDELFKIAEQEGYYGLDLFILIPTAIRPERWQRQHHARKRHSYLWVFQN